MLNIFIIGVIMEEWFQQWAKEENMCVICFYVATFPPSTQNT